MTTLDVEKEANTGQIANADFDVGVCLRKAIIPEFLDGVGNPGWRRRTAVVSAPEGSNGFSLPRDFMNMEGLYPSPNPNGCYSAKGIPFIGDDPARLAAAKLNTTPDGPCGYYLEYTPSATEVPVGPTSVSQYREIPAGVIDGVNKNFILEYDPIPGWTADLFLNQTKQYPPANIEMPGPITGYQYTISGKTITYVVAPKPGDVHEISYWRDAGSGVVPGTVTPRWFQRVGFQAPLNKTYSIVAVYYMQVPFPDDVTEVDLSQYIPENFQYTLVYGLRRNIYIDRYGQGDQRANAAGAKFLEGVENAKRGDMELARVHRPRFIR